MDHIYIEENQIADRYVMGTLPPEEAERFEDHYLSCPECLDRMELAESVKRGFQRMAGQDAAKLSAARQLAIVAWLARLGRQRQMGILLTVLLLAILPSGLALRGTAGRERELAEVRSTLEKERQRSALGTRSAAEAERLRAELEASRLAQARVSEQLAQVLQPQGVSSLDLGVERGAGPEGGEPTQRLRPPAGSRWIVLSLPIDPPFHRTYRAVLRDAHDHEISSIPDLRNQGETLTLGLPASLVPPGVYALSLEGLNPGAKPAPAGRFIFRVLPPA